VGLITPNRTHLNITKTRKGRSRTGPGCSATDDDDYDILIVLSNYLKNIIINLSVVYHIVVSDIRTHEYRYKMSIIGYKISMGLYSVNLKLGGFLNRSRCVLNTHILTLLGKIKDIYVFYKF
jgi:hypothetical protein